MKTKIGDTWYRYEDIQYAAPLDEFERPCGFGRLVVSIQEFFVAKITPQGVRLHTGRFVRNEARKKYAHATKADALASFIARKERQASIYAARLCRAEKALRLAREVTA